MIKRIFFVREVNEMRLYVTNETLESFLNFILLIKLSKTSSTSENIT